MPDLASRLMGLLFAAPDPLTVTSLSLATGCSADETFQALAELKLRLEHDGVLQLMQHDDEYGLVTAPAVAADISRLLGQTTRSDLSRPALETLAIIAYRGPVSINEIDGLRGVGSEAMVRNLLARDLITESSAQPSSGRLKSYVVARSFLTMLGLKSLADLPPLPVTEQATHEA